MIIYYIKKMLIVYIKCDLNLILKSLLSIQNFTYIDERRYNIINRI